ncbi:hypothetical protein C0995_004289 [Termitomyces sp. Mi166|nr:hypothetical protein C0995_004289 [Termitomyces sp. Mi166\
MILKPSFSRTLSSLFAAIPRRLSAKRHISFTSRVNAEALAEDVTIQQAFWEEPLGIGASMGYGWFLGGPGTVLGPQARYEIQNKLGFAQFSNLWLAHDRISSQAGATNSNKRKLARESEAYDRGEEHLCFVTDLRHSTLQQAMVAKQFYPVPALKKMLKHVLLGIAELHRQGIAHTNISPEHVVINNQRQWSTEAVAAWLKQNPPTTYPSTPYDPNNPSRIFTAYVSQQLPAPTLDEIVSCDFELAELSFGMLLSYAIVITIPNDD